MPSEEDSDRPQRQPSDRQGDGAPAPRGHYGTTSANATTCQTCFTSAPLRATAAETRTQMELRGKRKQKENYEPSTHETGRTGTENPTKNAQKQTIYTKKRGRGNHPGVPPFKRVGNDLHKEQWRFTEKERKRRKTKKQRNTTKTNARVRSKRRRTETESEEAPSRRKDTIGITTWARPTLPLE